MRTIRSTGRIVAGLPDVTVTGSPRVDGRNPFIYCHSAVGTSQEFIGAGLDNTTLLGNTIVRQGFTMTAVPDRAGTFGNPTAQGDLAAAVAFARASMGSSDDLPVLAGISMGTELMIAYALANPAAVACIVGVLPVDLEHAYANDVNSTRAGIAAAWGVAYPAPLPAGAQLFSRIAEIAHIPMLFHAGADDPYTSDGYAQFAADSGATVVVHDGYGHDTNLLNEVDMATVAAFVQAAVAA